MATKFTFDKTGIKDFAKEQKKKPYKMRRATADVLSAMAYQTKLVSFIEIEKTMTVRSKRFVQTALRYKRAKPSNIDNQESSAFSIERDRFSGWAEQMGENRDKRTRTQSLLARSKSFEKKVAPRNRAKPSNTFMSVNDFDNLPSGPNETPALIVRMKRKHKNKPFYIKRKYKQIKKGVYKFVRNKMMILQNMEKKPAMPKKNEWMTRAVEQVHRKANLQREWERAFKKIYTKSKF